MEGPMKLYGFPASPRTHKVMVTAAQLGIPLDLLTVNLMAGEAKRPEFLALNPNGRVPVLVDGDFVLWESTAIMQYLASLSPSPLFPEDARARADIARWQCWDLAHWEPSCATMIFENMLKPLVGAGAPNEAALETAAANFHRDAKVLEARLGAQDWLVGDGLTLADLSVGAALRYAVQARMPWDAYGAIKDWYGRLAALPAWQATLVAL
jgi:glutathione S-transferase